ncbi:hypothetical protein SHKM778_72550 [Streptomyces sp. KM77-8]|uniref:WYL domain-containing protein n=1 Tax=Streptomyces haneummycinicus TaxID=3074435 RepID=A0AAT9HUB6_9ACTN
MERELEPYGLVLKAGVWYLCARVCGGGGFRVYRVDRFTGVSVGGEAFERVSSFDLPGFWEERAEGFARSLVREEVVVRLSGEGVRRLGHVVDPVAAREAVSGAEAEGEAEGEGWVRVVLGVESEEVAFTQLTALGAEVEVLAPLSLRERFVGEAARLASLYRG